MINVSLVLQHPIFLVVAFAVSSPCKWKHAAIVLIFGADIYLLYEFAKDIIGFFFDDADVEAEQRCNKQGLNILLIFLKVFL